MKYICDWPGCKTEFEADPKQWGTGKKCVGSQVKCPGCGNFLPNKSGK